MSKSKWKENILKSGLPLEFEIHKILKKYNCISDYEYTYSKLDENQNHKYFSYDIDALDFFDDACVNLMIECKYRHESTKWYFIPEEYGGHKMVYPNTFMHPIHEFIAKDSSSILAEYESYPFRLGPLCAKGIEIYENGSNNKTITQAINQLSYAMASKYISGVVEQFNIPTFKETIFYSIPIVITTAELRLMKTDISIKKIHESEFPEEVSTKEDILVYYNRTSEDLKLHNLNIINQLLTDRFEKFLCKKHFRKLDEVKAYLYELARYDLPRAIIFLHYDGTSSNISKILDYIHNVIKPNAHTLDTIKDYENTLKKAVSAFSQIFDSKHNQ